MRLRTSGYDSKDIDILKAIASHPNSNLHAIMDSIGLTYVALRNRVHRMEKERLIIIARNRYTGNMTITNEGLKVIRSGPTKTSVPIGPVANPYCTQIEGVLERANTIMNSPAPQPQQQPKDVVFGLSQPQLNSPPAVTSGSSLMNKIANAGVAGISNNKKKLPPELIKEIVSQEETRISGEAQPKKKHHNHKPKQTPKPKSVVHHKPKPAVKKSPPKKTHKASPKPRPKPGATARVHKRAAPKQTRDEKTVERIQHEAEANLKTMVGSPKVIELKKAGAMSKHHERMEARMNALDSQFKPVGLGIVPITAKEARIIEGKGKKR